MHQALLARAAAWAAAAMLAACAAPPQPTASPGGGVVFPDAPVGPVRLPVATMMQVRQAGTVLQSYDFSCGSAALATLLTHHYAEPVSENEVLQAMYSMGDQDKIRREGFSMLDMKRYLADIGYTADGFEQPLDKLAAARLPAIVLINDGGYQHFVVIKGLDRERILLGDPARGIRAMPRADFERVWIGKLLFVIHNHQERVRFNTRADWTAAPRAPMYAGRILDGTSSLPKMNPGDY